MIFVENADTANQEVQTCVLFALILTLTQVGGNDMRQKFPVTQY